MINASRMRTISAFLLVILFSNPVLAVGTALVYQEPISYKDMSELHLASFDLDPAPVVPTDPIAAAKEQQKLDLEIKKLSDRKCTERTYQLLDNIALTKQGSSVNGMKWVFKDFDLFCGPVEFRKSTLLNTISDTVTPFGLVMQANMLANPLKQGQIQQRQKAVKFFVENSEVFGAVDQSLQEVAAALPALFAAWEIKNQLTTTMINMLYYKMFGDYALTRKLDRNATALWMGTWLFSARFVNTLGLGYFAYGIKGSLERLPQHRAQLEEAEGVARAGLLTEYNRSTIQSNIRIGLQNIQTEQISIATQALNAAMIGITSGIDLDRKIKTRNYVHTQCIGLARLLDCAREIVALADENPVLAEGLTLLPTLRSALDGSSEKSDDFKELVEILQTNTFKGEASFFSRDGRVLKAYTLLAAAKHEFGDIAAAIGEVDALISVAKLYKKHEHGRVKYCFVEFVESNQPYLELENFWNPMVNPDVVVTNNITLNGNATRAAIVTGSNTGGKSTLIKAIMTDVLLAQSFGIAAASKAVMTPFTLLGSSLNIVDNIATGESLFQAEANRAHGLIDAAHAVEKGSFGFIVIDELFRGTSPDQAGELTASCAKQLLEADNVLFILASHFIDAVTPLEKETNGVIKNYKVDVVEQDGKIVSRPFKLELGITTNKVANAIFNNPFKFKK